MATFGRTLQGAEDALPGYRLDVLTISNPEVAGVSGSEHHPVVVPTGAGSDMVLGQVFEVSAEELAAADVYEDSDYQRVQVTLASSLTAWLYVARRSTERLVRIEAEHVARRHARGVVG